MPEIEAIIEQGNDFIRRYRACIDSGMSESILETCGIRHEEANLWYEQVDSILSEHNSEDSDVLKEWRALKESLGDEQSSALRRKYPILEGNLSHVSKCMQFLTKNSAPKRNPKSGMPSIVERLNRHPITFAIMMIGSIASIIGLAALWFSESSHEIEQKNLGNVSVPDVTVKLYNSSEDSVSVLTRGDFFLWLPGSDGHHTVGKYQFHSGDGKPIQNMTLDVEPQTTTTLLANIANQETYGRILEAEECDIALHVRRANGTLTFTENLPFTVNAIRKCYVTADVGIKESETKNSGEQHNKRIQWNTGTR